MHKQGHTQGIMTLKRGIYDTDWKHLGDIPAHMEPPGDGEGWTPEQLAEIMASLKDSQIEGASDA